MKRSILILLLCLASVLQAFAVVAPKVPYPYKQPDGSVIMLVNHGDEFYSWVTTPDGTYVQRDADGYYRPASGHPARGAAARMAVRRRSEERQRQDAARAVGIGHGEKPFLVVLVEFSDLKFTLPASHFHRLLNEAAYAENGGTGSARDFFLDQSAGEFAPSFEVVGPFQVSKPFAYYGAPKGTANDTAPGEAFTEACKLADATVDFSRYDIDGDGWVDNVFFYYAGHNQAEGGGEDTIWPHASGLYGSGVKLDGCSLGRYACTSEYRGNSSSVNMAGIGTFVHEFGHVLGLPDFYDTDYEENGEAQTIGNFSTMCIGSYLNEGRTPSNYSSWERHMLGWMEEPRLLDLTGDYKLGSLSSHSRPYWIASDVPGESFILEVRDGTGWDSFLPQGMLVYHRDASDFTMPDNMLTAGDLWDTGHGINCYAEHPCYYLVASSHYADEEAIVFPGNANVRFFTPKAWSGADLSYQLLNIDYSMGSVSFHMETEVRRRVFGTVTDTEGKPVEGAAITLEMPQSATRARKPIAPGQHRTAAGAYTAETDADGSFTIYLDHESGDVLLATASARGYLSQTQEIYMTSPLIECNFVIRSVFEPTRGELSKVKTGVSYGGLGYGNAPTSIMSATRFSQVETQAYAGMQITSISYMLKGSTADSVHLLVDAGGKRLLCYQIPKPVFSQWAQVDITELGLYVPAGKDLYLGIAIKNSDDGFPLAFQSVTGETLYYSDYNLNNLTWAAYDNASLAVMATVKTEEGQKAMLSDMGFNSIRNPQPEEGWSAGDLFYFRISEAPGHAPADVVWFFDGEKQSDSIRLPSGNHLVQAHLYYSDGEEEVLSLELSVN